MTAAQQMLLGARRGGIVALAGGAADDITIAPTNADAGWRWNTNGTVDTRIAGAYSYSHNWFSPTTAGIGSGYFIHRGAVTGTALTTDTVGTAGTASLATSKEIRLTTTANGFLSSSMAINITSASGLTPIVTSGTYSINAERGV